MALLQGERMRALIWLPIIAMFGCAHKQQVNKASTAQTSSPATSTAMSAGSTDKSCSGDLDCGDKQLCIRSRCVDITANLAECSNVRLHFAFNSSELSSADKPGLERSARCLKADHQLHVTIEGNADERGTEEYNMALGDRRAGVVRDYLEALGASSAQLKTVSYGKENPLCTQHDEECWAQNRRAEMKGVETASAKPKTLRR
jgi:peptidoglycan-associated lipoprotein